MDDLPRPGGNRVRKRENIILGRITGNVCNNGVQAQSFLYKKDLVNARRGAAGSERTFITALMYGMASKSLVVNSVSPRALIFFRVSMISSRSLAWTSGYFASSYKPHAIYFDWSAMPETMALSLTVMAVVSWAANMIVLSGIDN